MQTITDEVGSGSIGAVTYAVLEQEVGSETEDHTDGARLDLGERVPVSKPRNVNITSGLDGKHQRCDLNQTRGPAPKGEIVDTVNDGPNLEATNDNDVLARNNIVNEPKA
jgi:hypothetical protein